MLRMKRMYRTSKGDKIVKLDLSSLGSVLETFSTGKHDSIVTFKKNWIDKPPFGRTSVSIPEGISEVRVNRDLLGKSIDEEVYLNLFEERGKYIIKVGPSNFEAKSKEKGYSVEEFLQKWRELQPDKYNTWKGGVEMEQEFQKIIIQYGNEYADYWYDVVAHGANPMSYDEWLENEQYAQDCIDQSRLTEAERYGL
jgi:hypothetical protein